MFLNVGGRLHPLLSLILQHIDQTWLCSKCQPLSTGCVISCAIYRAEVTGFLMSLLYTVVFAFVIDFNSNRRDVHVSRSDILCFNSPEHNVRYSSTLHPYCSLSHHSAPESPNFPKRTSRMTSNTEKNFCIVQNPPSNRLDVTVHKSFEEYPMSQMNHCGSHHSSDGKPVDKPLHDLGLDDNV